PDHWEFYDFHGTHHGGDIQVQGRSDPTPQGNHLTVQVRGNQIAFDEDLYAALKPVVQKAWHVLRPTGRFGFVVNVEKGPGMAEPTLDVTVTPAGCSIYPAFFPYALDLAAAVADGPGTVRYNAGQIHLERLKARHGTTSVTLNRGEV